jgi:2-methylaconitate cis-trans-isomerase PrpF
VGEGAGSRSDAKTKVLGATKEAKPDDLHYIFLQATVNEPIISVPRLSGNVTDKSCYYSRATPDYRKCGFGLIFT